MTNTETNGTPHWRERKERGREGKDEERERGGKGERKRREREGRRKRGRGKMRKEKTQRKVKQKKVTVKDRHLVLSVISCWCFIVCEHCGGHDNTPTCTNQ